MSGCNCEAAMHETEAVGFCPGGNRLLRARADHVGPVCDACALSCMSDYLIEIGGLTLSDQPNSTWCHSGKDGPTCVGHEPDVVEVATVTVEDACEEILGDFYGDRRYANARTLMRAIALSESRGGLAS